MQRVIEQDQPSSLPVTGRPCTIPSLRATLLNDSLAIFGVSVYI